MRKVNFYNSIENYKLFTIYVMGFMYIFIGIRHFIDPQYFLHIVPPQLSFKLFLVYISGLIEIIGGAAILNPKTRRKGALLLVFLLLVVFPANIYLYALKYKPPCLGGLYFLYSFYTNNSVFSYDIITLRYTNSCF